MRRGLIVIAVAMIAVGVAITWASAPPTGVRITPRNVAPGTAVQCVAQSAWWGTPDTAWRLDGQPLDGDATIQVPDAPGKVLACVADDREDSIVIRPDTPRNNILFVLLDDIGVDRIGLYGVSDITPRTPTLDRLAAQGVRFTQAYSSPSCTPTRVGALTGLHPMNAGIANPLHPSEHGLPLRFHTLPEALDDLTDGAYAHAAIGKWHITAPDEGLDAPNRTGFQHYAGNLANLAHGDGGGYFRWPRVEDGVEATSRTYATTDNIDSTLSFIERTGDKPWFVWLAFNTAHVPFHEPPKSLFPRGLGPNASGAAKFDAMVTAADRELGRLLRSLPEAVRARTTVIVMGDNGTATEAVRPPTAAGRAKFSVYEGGIHVPLVVAGAGVQAPGRTVDALVSYVDLFPTIVHLAGADLGLDGDLAIDGTSFMHHLVSPDAPAHRKEIYAEVFWPNGLDLARRKGWVRMLRRGPYKLVTRAGQPDELYRIRRGQDGRNLLLTPNAASDVDRKAYVGLKQALEQRYQPRR